MTGLPQISLRFLGNPKKDYAFFRGEYRNDAISMNNILPIRLNIGNYYERIFDAYVPKAFLCVLLRYAKQLVSGLRR